jgi:hypothetical protein
MMQTTGFLIIFECLFHLSTRCIAVDIGSYGNDFDSTIFKRSTLWTAILTNMLELPSERRLSGTEGPNVPYFFVGDEEITLNRNILRPFGRYNLSVKKGVYSNRYFRARKYFECAFGILDNKWRIFQRLLYVSRDFAVVIVKTCVVLHNFVRDRDGYKFEDAFVVTDLQDVPHGQSVLGRLTANNERDKVAVNEA